jgi:hypothetical protein
MRLWDGWDTLIVVGMVSAVLVLAAIAGFAA